MRIVLAASAALFSFLASASLGSAACGPGTAVDSQQAVARATAAADRAARDALGAERAPNEAERNAARAGAVRWMAACRAALETAPDFPMPANRNDAAAAAVSLHYADESLADAGAARRLAAEREPGAAKLQAEAQRLFQRGTRRTEIELAQMRARQEAATIDALRRESAALADAADSFACHAAKLVAKPALPAPQRPLSAAYCDQRFAYARGELLRQAAAAAAAAAATPPPGASGQAGAAALLGGTMAGLLQEKYDPHVKEHRDAQRAEYGSQGRRVPLSEDDIALMNLWSIPIGNPPVGQPQPQQAATPPAQAKPEPSKSPAPITPKPATPKPAGPVSGFAVAPEVPKRVCGPDVTNPVFNALDRIYRDYYALSADEQKEKCELLVGVTPSLSFEGAWDIDRLSPEWAPDPKKETPAQIAGKKYWFENVSPRCAIPREPCGPSVEFLGQCLHAQVVNYTMWGAVNLLCGQREAGERMHLARQIAKNLPNTEPADPYKEQKAMADIGEGFVALRGRDDAKPASGPVSGFTTDPKPGSALKPESKEHRARTIEFLKKKLAGLLKGSDRAERLCALPCPAGADEMQTMASSFHYHWGKAR